MGADELPTDMEAVIAQLDEDYASLLKAYQEQRRALERLASSEAFDLPQPIDGPLAQELRMRLDYARAALNQKGDER
jgi:hypothetical protein